MQVSRQFTYLQKNLQRIQYDIILSIQPSLYSFYVCFFFVKIYAMKTEFIQCQNHAHWSY